MKQSTLWVLAGVAAIAGGLIDLVGPLPYPHLAEPARQAVYVLIDVLLLLGLLGLQSATGDRTGRLGVIGLVVAVSAILLVRSSETHLLGPSTYALASSLWVIGMVAISAAILRARLPYRIPAGLWIATLVVGLAGIALRDQGLAHRLAAACFALASIALGAQLIRQGRVTSGDIA